MCVSRVLKKMIFNLCVCPGSWAACGPVWHSFTRQLTAAWETTTWFTSTSKRRSALQSSSPSSPHTSSYLLTSISPHVSLTFCPVCFYSVFHHTFWHFAVFSCSNTSLFNLWKVPAIQSQASHCAFGCARARLCVRYVPVWCRDNPHTGTLYTAVRLHPANTFLPCQYKH